MPTVYRQDSLDVGEIYHVMNKSIAGFKIFHSNTDYLRMKRMMQYFQNRKVLPKFSQFLELASVREKGFEAAFREMTNDSKQYIDIIAYCFMPTHIHILARQLSKNGISKLMANLLNSYARYFNTKHDRRGPLWVGRFKSVLVKKDEQLLHLTRYFHLNPTTAELTSKPQDWQWSSYQEYTQLSRVEHPICQFSDLFNISPKQYEKFTNDHIDYQRQLAAIKKLTLE